MALDTPWPWISEVASRTEQWCLVYNQSRRESPRKLERLEKQWLLNRFCQKLSLHFGEDKRILFPEREAAITKRWGISNLWQESTSEFQRSKSQLVHLPGGRVRIKGWYQTSGEEGRPSGFVWFLLWFCFLNRNVQSGKAVMRNTIWY